MATEKWEKGDYWFVFCFCAVIGSALLFVLGAACYESGHDAAEKEARDARECDCGETKSCAFAPGIVGVRTCKRYDNRWDRCEPDPQYRTVDALGQPIWPPLPVSP